MRVYLLLIIWWYNSNNVCLTFPQPHPQQIFPHTSTHTHTTNEAVSQTTLTYFQTTMTYFRTWLLTWIMPERFWNKAFVIFMFYIFVNCYLSLLRVERELRKSMQNASVSIFHCFSFSFSVFQVFQFYILCVFLIPFLVLKIHFYSKIIII